MKKGAKRGPGRGGEYAVIAALLTVYALAIFLTPDPEWVVWAGQMSVGVIDPSALPPPMPAGALEGLRTASTLAALGVLAVAVLAAAATWRPGWLARLTAGHAHGTHGGAPRA